MNKDFWFAQLVSITKSPFYLHRIRSTIHCGSFRHFEGQCAGFSRRFHQKPATILFNCPVVLKLSLLNLHLCLRTTATVDDFIEYQISKLRIETVLKIKLQLQRPSQNWNKSYLHCAIVELKCAFMINWMKRRVYNMRASEPASHASQHVSQHASHASHASQHKITLFLT